MKRICFLIFVLLGINVIRAEFVSNQTATTAALNFFQMKYGEAKTISETHVEMRSDSTFFYLYNFDEGGWAMVAADKGAYPILAYGLNGSLDLDDEHPEAMLALFETYKDEITHIRTKASLLRNAVVPSKISQEWEELLSFNTNTRIASGDTYTIATNLLNVPGRGKVAWGQSKNNNGGYSPAYNSYLDNLLSCENSCDRIAVGCGPVAMGQTMWYWQWPPKSPHRNYRWDLIVPALYNTSTTAEGNAVAGLLKDCGWGRIINLFCKGSLMTVDQIKTAISEDFDYNGSTKFLKGDWRYEDSWYNLLQSEIDAGRPVIFRGDARIDSAHIFILSGHDGDHRFYINWGWRGSYESHSYEGTLVDSYFKLSNMEWYPDLGYNLNHRAIVGISPTYPKGENISDLDFTEINGAKVFVEADENISLPASNKTLSIDHGGNVTFIAGEEIILNPGFSVEQGCSFSAKTNSESIMDIALVSSPTVFTKGSNLVVQTRNANSYELQVINPVDTTIIFQGAGYIPNNAVTIWDGTEASTATSYVCKLSLKNNYGRRLTRNFTVTVQ